MGETRSVVQPFAGMAHPADPPRRMPPRDANAGTSLGHDGACGDQAVLAERAPADDSGIRADRGAPLDEGGGTRLSVDLRPRGEHVGEHAGGAAEYAVFQDDAFVDLTLFWILQRSPIATSGPIATFWPMMQLRADAVRGRTWLKCQM